MKKQLLLLFALLFGVISYAQIPVVYFPLNSNLAFQTPPVPPVGTTLNYSNSVGNPKTPTFESSWLRGTGAGDYLELSIDTSTLNNLAISFDAKFSAGIGFGTWNVLANTGPSNSFQQFTSITLGSLFGSTSYGSLLEGLPAAANGKSDLKIRIQVDFGWNLGDNLRINNLKLLTGNPKIKVYSNINTEIPNNADAAVIYNTVFLDLQTLLEPGESKTYRVRNFNGTTGSQLNVTNIEIEPSSGTTADDFIVAATNNITNLNVVTGNSASPYGEITIKFVPQGEGVRRAIVKVYSNGTPSPYSFTVIGGGKSCDVSNTPHVVNTADNGVQTLPSDLSTGDFVGGTSNNPLPTGVLPVLYPALSNLYTSASTCWYTKNLEKERIFGGVNGIDISKLKNVSVEFNVAAFADGNVNTKGVTNTDYIILSVTDENGNFFDVMRLNGSNNNSPRKYAFNPTGRVFTKDYNLSLTTESNYSDNTSASGNGNSRARASFKFNIPLQYSKDLRNFKFKIRARANANAVWLIDDISIKSNNANFKTWDGSKWVPDPANQRPGTKEKAVFDGDYDFTKTGETGDLTVCECEVNAGKTLTIPANKTLTVQGNVINNGTAVNFIVSSDANLIQKDPGAQNVGNITVNRDVSNLRNNPGSNPLVNAVDYVYWSSPVAGQNLQAFSPGTPAANILQYREATDYFVTSYDGVFKPAKGYAIRAEGGPSPTPYNKTYQFVGPANNGDFKIAITRSPDTGGNIHGYNLIGNPYPSNINFDKLYANNPTLIHNTVWFWKNNTYTPTQQGQGYTGNNYVVYNGTGGSAPGVTGIVKVGQGFLIQKTNLGSDSLVFKNLYDKNNVLRVSISGTFYQKNNESKNRFWLKLISPNTGENTQLIGYVEGATDDFEQDYDAEAFGLSSDLFYSVLNNKRLLIQGRSAQFNADDHVLLGANFFENQTYTIALAQPEGIFEGTQIIYLKDHQTGIITNLSQGNYSFQANSGESTGRFEIIYKPETVLSTHAAVKEDLVVYKDGGDFVVKAPTKKITGLEVYDMSGRMMMKLKPNDTKVIIPASTLSSGMYLLKVDQGGLITGKKVIK